MGNFYVGRFRGGCGGGGCEVVERVFMNILWVGFFDMVGFNFMNEVELKLVFNFVVIGVGVVIKV